MNRVWGYLDDTLNYVLHYNKYSVVVEEYSDANWIIGKLKQNLQIDRFLLVVEEIYLGNHPNKPLSIALQWTLNSSP